MFVIGCDSRRRKVLVVRQKLLPPTSAKKIRLTKGMTAFVSPEDFIKVSQFYWRAVKSSGNYYAHARIIKKGKTTTIRMHRFVMSCQAWEKIHHLDHNTLNNCRENLLVISERQHRTFDGWHYFEH